MNTKSYLILTKRYKFLISALHSFYRLVNSSSNLGNFIMRMTKLIYQILNASSCRVIVLDNSKTRSLFSCRVTKKKLHFIDKKSIVTNHLEKHIIRTSSSIFNKYILGVPIIAEDIIGLIIISRKSNQPCFDVIDQQFLMTIAEQTVTGIKTFQLFEEQKKIILGSIKSLITLLDTKLPRGYTHSPYFSRLVTTIAQQMRLREDQIKALQYAGMLHDAGKLDVPLEILTKPTKLTRSEFKIIKGHPLKGVQIIKHLEILKPVIPIILHHHERYDGKGYPSGLKGDKIPLGARIMALADAFEAMVYGRPYRKRMDLKSALEEIKKKSGTQFDPKVVEAFLKAVKFIKIKKYLQLIN